MYYMKRGIFYSDYVNTNLLMILISVLTEICLLHYTFLCTYIFSVVLCSFVLLENVAVQTCSFNNSCS